MKKPLTGNPCKVFCCLCFMETRKEILIKRSIWYISGSVDIRGLHPEDDLYKYRLVGLSTIDKVIKFMKDNNMPLIDGHKNDLELKCRGLLNNAGISTGNLWRSYPSCKVNSFYDNLYPNELGPDIIKNFKIYFDVEHKRIKSFQEKYEKLCNETIEKGGTMNMPDVELHRYIDTFPDTFEEFLKDRSKYVVDQLYTGLKFLKNDRSYHIVGSIPDFCMKENIDPDLNIIFNRKPISEDFIAIDIYPKDQEHIEFIYLINKNNPRYDEFLEMSIYISSMLSWGLDKKYFLIDGTTYQVSDYIESKKTPNIENIFELNIGDFLR